MRRDGYSLLGFATDSNSNEVEITESELNNYLFTEDITLYGVYEPGTDCTISGNTGCVVPDPVSVVLKGATLSLDGKIRLNFYVQIPQKAISEVNAVILLNNKKYNIKGLTAEQRSSNLFVFTVEVPAKEMRDAVVIQF